MARVFKNPFAHAGDKVEIAELSQPDGRISIEDGWTPDYELPNDDPNYKPVERDEMNGLFNEVTAALGEMQLNGFAVWRSIAGGWPEGALVSHQGAVWKSTAGGNNTEPGSGASWERVLANVSLGGGIAIDDQGRLVVDAELKGFSSVQDFVESAPKEDSVNIISYYGGWEGTVDGPKGGFTAHRTGYSADSPSVGNPVAPSTIGTGEQAGLFWTADGEEWRKSRLSEFLVDNAGEDTGGPGVATIIQRKAATLPGLEQFNYSGTKADGTHTRADGAQSQVLHHYNDRDAVTWDNTGRGNTIHLLRMAYNASASGHTEVGSGYFQRFERTVMHDSNFEPPNNRTLAGFKQVDLYDLGLSAERNSWAFAIHGKDATLTTSIGPSYIQEAIHFLTYGTASNTGAAALKAFSGDNGGNAVEIQTKAQSKGRAISINHSAPGNAAVTVHNHTLGGSPSYVSISEGVDGKNHYVVQQTVDQLIGFALLIQDSMGNTTGGLSADGRNLFLTDTATGELRSVRVTNGQIVVS